MTERFECSNCGGMNPVSASFCTQCFARFSGPRPVPSVKTAPVLHSPHTPPAPIPSVTQGMPHTGTAIAPPQTVYGNDTHAPQQQPPENTRYSTLSVHPVETPSWQGQAYTAPAPSLAPPQPYALDVNQSFPGAYSNPYQPVQTFAVPPPQPVSPAQGLAFQTWTPDLAAVEPLPAENAGPILIPVAKEKERARWTWGHLALFGFLAWGLPQAMDQLLSSTKLSTSQFLGAALYVQALGYMLAAGAIYLMVKHFHDGDWHSLGLKSLYPEWPDVLRGTRVGVAMLAIWLPIGFVLKGRMSVDSLVHLLIGKTSGGGLLLAAAVLIVGAPFIEEIYYRGMLYDKVKRWTAQGAIVITAILFTIAHGSILLPSIFVMGLVLAAKRRTESLWYTMGAHAAWNAGIVLLGAFLLLGPPKTFYSEDNVYSLTYSRTWERTEQLEKTSPNAIVDLRLVDPSGAEIALGRIPAMPADAVAEIPNILRAVSTSREHPNPQVTRSHLLPTNPTVHETLGPISVGGKRAIVRTVAMKLEGSSSLHVATLVCLERVCSEVTRDFESMIHSIAVTK